MTKILVIIALLAMSYLASADVASWGLPLSLKDLANDQAALLAQSCITTDDKLYYLDGASDSLVLQVWDYSAQEQNANISLTNVEKQVNALITATNGNTQVVLQCVGTSVYMAVAYTNTTNTGLQLFSVNTSGTVTIYPLPLKNTHYATDNDLRVFLSSTAQTADGKLYYLDGSDDAAPQVLQVWDSTNQSQASSINITALVQAQDAFDKSLGDLASSTVILTSIGTNVYLNQAYEYENNTSGGIVLFEVQTDGSVPAHNLPYSGDHKTDEEISYKSSGCSTTNGDYYYLDFDANDSPILQQWDSNDQANDVNYALGDFFTQQTAFFANIKNVNTSINLQCTGKDVYYNVAYTNGTLTGIEVFQIKKSAAVLSFSAALLAFVALLL